MGKMLRAEAARREGEKQEALGEGSGEAPQALQWEGGPGAWAAGLGRGLAGKEEERGSHPASGRRRGLRPR